MLDRIWDDIAYIARYGKQPLSEILALNKDGRRRFIAALSRIIEQENRPPPTG